MEQRLDRGLAGIRSRDGPKQKRVSLSGDHAASVVSKAFQTVSVGSLVNRGDPLRERVLAELSRGLVKRVGREPYLVRKESPLLERGLGVV